MHLIPSKRVSKFKTKFKTIYMKTRFQYSLNLWILNFSLNFNTSVRKTFQIYYERTLCIAAKCYMFFFLRVLARVRYTKP